MTKADTILPFTKIVAAVIIPFLVAAFIILYFFPAQSGSHFAWEIKPAMTAVWMGAGYLGGAYFFLRVILSNQWHRVAAGFWAVTAFTWAMLLTTLLHWSRFDLSHLPFQIWLVLYAVTPFLVPFVWWRNQATDPRVMETDDVAVPRVARLGMALIGGFMLLSCLICYLAPDVAIDLWPWALTPLTARVLGGWFALMGVGGFMMAGEPRWSGWQYEVESIIFVWHALVLVGAFVHSADFKPGADWFFVAETAAILGLVAFYLMMQSKRRQR